MKRPGGTLGIPAALAALTLAALIVGLLGEGGYDLFAWIGLALPLGVMAIAPFVVATARRRDRGPRRRAR